MAINTLSEDFGCPSNTCVTLNAYELLLQGTRKMSLMRRFLWRFDVFLLELLLKILIIVYHVCLMVNWSDKVDAAVGIISEVDAWRLGVCLRFIGYSCGVNRF